MNTNPAAAAAAAAPLVNNPAAAAAAAPLVNNPAAVAAAAPLVTNPAAVAAAAPLVPTPAAAAAAAAPLVTNPAAPPAANVISLEDFTARFDELVNQLSPESKTALFEQAKTKIQQTPEISNQIIPQGSYNGAVGSTGKLDFFYIRSKDFGIVKNADDKYNIFDKIKKSLFSELKDVLHEDGIIKGMKVGYQSNKERLRKYYYLFHNVLSREQPVNALQYACMWNRLDMVILILSYLVGSSKEYVKKYINYAIPTEDSPLQGMRAIDLLNLNANESLGVRSSVSQGVSALTQLPKVIFNPFGMALKAMGKTAKAVGQVTQQSATGVGAIDNPIYTLLKEFGSKDKGDPTGLKEDMDVDIKEVDKEQQNTQADPYQMYGGSMFHSPMLEKMMRTRKFRRVNKGKKQRGKTARR